MERDMIKDVYRSLC